YPESLEPLFAQIAAMTGQEHYPPLREGGRVVYTDLRGPGVAGLTQFHPDKGQDPYDLTGYDLRDVVNFIYGTGQNRQTYPAILRYINFVEERDTLDSFGNTETIPPYELGDASYPLGRLMRGMTNRVGPDPTTTRMFESQSVQPPVYVDTNWLLVAHIDETVSFIKSDSPRGWSLVANDPAMARQMLTAQRDAGHGDVPMFVGKFEAVDPEDCTSTFSGWRCPEPTVSMTVTIAETLEHSQIMAATARAAIEVESQLEVLRAEIGLEDDEIILSPFLHEQVWGTSIAYQPGTVNGIALSDDVFGAPDPHGPVIDGEDIFKAEMRESFGRAGVDVHFIENWDLYHVYYGEVHCGSNVRRQIDGENHWWEVSP
ncbi:MAG: protein-arginine deiminase family protein, partial [Bradymonadaceae bacterium]